MNHAQQSQQICEKCRNRNESWERNCENIHPTLKMKRVRVYKAIKNTFTYAISFQRCTSGMELPKKRKELDDTYAAENLFKTLECLSTPYFHSKGERCFTPWV
jgi:hypothetical protein